MVIELYERLVYCLTAGDYFYFVRKEREMDHRNVLRFSLVP